MGPGFSFLKSFALSFGESSDGGGAESPEDNGARGGVGRVGMSGGVDIRLRALLRPPMRQGMNLQTSSEGSFQSSVEERDKEIERARDRVANSERRLANGGPAPVG